MATVPEAPKAVPETAVGTVEGSFDKNWQVGMLWGQTVMATKPDILINTTVHVRGGHRNGRQIGIVVVQTVMKCHEISPPSIEGVEGRI
jgi:hypothetical protein